jgi:lipoate-protein ligase A
MRVLRGRGETLAADGEITQSLVESVGETGEPAVRVWQPPKNVAFGRRDSNREGYDRAREYASEQGYPVADRSVGGHAVAFTGNTIAFARVEPVDDARSGISERYDRLTELTVSAMEALGVDVTEGEPEGSFCPGTHSLSATGKIVGLAQRVHSDAAIASGILICRDHDEIARVLDPIYRALDVAFAPDAVGSLRRAGGETERAVVLDTLGEHLTGEKKAVVEEV